MSKKLNTYIVTHKQIEWEIPFSHKLITVGDYKQEGGLHAANYIEKELNDNRTFAFYSGVIAAIKDMERGGPGCLNSVSSLISGTSAGFRPPRCAVAG